jgi:glutamyl/glutaminyl-tRNA synthetase
VAQKHVRFAELLTLHLSNKIKKAFPHGTSLNDVKLREIRDCIRDTVREVFNKSSYTLAPESINWIANQYFKSIRINNEQTVNDIIIINEYKLADLPYHDIQLMRSLFNETQMFHELEAEYCRRNAS